MYDDLIDERTIRWVVLLYVITLEDMYKGSSLMEIISNWDKKKKRKIVYKNLFCILTFILQWKRNCKNSPKLCNELTILEKERKKERRNGKKILLKKSTKIENIGQFLNKRDALPDVDSAMDFTPFYFHFRCNFKKVSAIRSRGKIAKWQQAGSNVIR